MSTRREETLEWFNEFFAALNDVSGVISELSSLEYSADLSHLVHGVAFRDYSIFNSVDDTAEGLTPWASEIRILEIDGDSFQYSSDLKRMLDMLHGKFTEVEVRFPRDVEWVDASKAPLSVLEYMRALSKHEPEDLALDVCTDTYEVFRDMNLPVSDYEEARTVIQTIEHVDPNDGDTEKVTYLIDRLTRKVYVMDYERSI